MTLNEYRPALQIELLLRINLHLKCIHLKRFHHIIICSYAFPLYAFSALRIHFMHIELIIILDLGLRNKNHIFFYRRTGKLYKKVYIKCALLPLFDEISGGKVCRGKSFAEYSQLRYHLSPFLSLSHREIIKETKKIQYRRGKTEIFWSDITKMLQRKEERCGE